MSLNAEAIEHIVRDAGYDPEQVVNGRRLFEIVEAAIMGALDEADEED